MLGLDFNALAAHGKYLVLHIINLTIPIQMQLSQKQKTFPQIFAKYIQNLSEILNALKKKMTRTAFIFPD